MLNIVVADDHPLFRIGIIKALKYLDETFITNESANGFEVLEFLEKNPCDLIIMDINMPKLNGIKTTEIIRKKFPNVKVVGVSMFDDPYHVSKMVEAGANGYTTKEINIEDLQIMIRTVLDGGFYISKELSCWLSKEYKLSIGKSEVSVNEELTEREIEILILLCGQLSSKEIATKLNISYRTVQTHRVNISEKTGVINTVGLVLYAIDKGYILISK